MSELQLQGLVLRNWVKFGSTHIQFPEYGLVAVTGLNTSAGGKFMSIGSGKTALGEGIGRVLFGVQNRFTHLKEASRNGQGNTYAKITALYRGKPLVVEAGYKCAEISPTGEGLRFHYDGRTVERGHIQQTRTELESLLGVDPRLAAWTIFVDGQYMRFSDLSQTESVDLVMSALKQPPWNTYHERTKKSVQVCKRDLAAEEALETSAKARLESCRESVYSASAALDSANRLYVQQQKTVQQQIAHQKAKIEEHLLGIQSNEARRKEIKKEMERLIEEKAQANHTAEIAWNEVRDRLQGAQQRRAKLREAVNAASTVNALAKEAYQTILNVPKVCPTCTKPWDNQPDPQDAAKKKSAFEQASSKLAKAQAALRAEEEAGQVLVKEEEACARHLRESGTRDTTRALSLEFSQLESAVTETNRTIHSLEVSIERLQQTMPDTAVRAAEAVLGERKRAQEEAEAHLATATAASAEARQALGIVSYWCSAFSPAGIPNMILQDAVAPLNHETRRISSLMTGGSIEVKFATKRTLVSGESRPQLYADVDNTLGSQSAKLNSKGESGLTNFIIAEALGAVGQVSKRIGFRWYDEIVPHQDAVVCQSLYGYLRDLAQNLRILIFIVDHNPAVSNYADYFLQVEKAGEGEDCVSTAKWL